MLGDNSFIWDLLLVIPYGMCTICFWLTTTRYRYFVYSWPRDQLLYCSFQGSWPRDQLLYNNWQLIAGYWMIVFLDICQWEKMKVDWVIVSCLIDFMKIVLVFITNVLLIYITMYFGYTLDLNMSSVYKVCFRILFVFFNH